MIFASETFTQLKKIGKVYIFELFPRESFAIINFPSAASAMYSASYLFAWRLGELGQSYPNFFSNPLTQDSRLPFERPCLAKHRGPSVPLAVVS